MDSKLNTTIQSLAGNTSFIGKNEVVNGYLNIICNLKTTKDCIIKCEQSTNGSEYQFTEQFTHDVSVYGDVSRTQFAVKAYWVRISVLNNTVDDIPKMVLTTLFSKANKDGSYEQPITIAGDVNVLNSMKATYSNGGVDNIIDVACDENGVLKSNLVIEGITLDPATDGIKIFGSTTQRGAGLLINTDTNGRINANMIGTSDGDDRIMMKTDLGGTLNTVSTSADALITSLNALVTENKALLQKLEINANQAPDSSLLVYDLEGLEYAAGDPIGNSIDMGSMESRNNDICFSGYVSIVEKFLEPKLIMQYSLADTQYFGDGVECSFYKKSTTEWEFNFQRNNVGPRFVRLLCTSPAKIKLCLATSFKN